MSRVDLKTLYVMSFYSPVDRHYGAYNILRNGHVAVSYIVVKSPPLH